MTLACCVCESLISFMMVDYRTLLRFTTLATVIAGAGSPGVRVRRNGLLRASPNERAELGLSLPWKSR